MDAVTLLFHAIVCGLLGAAGPKLGRLWARLAIGAVIGVTAAAMLPLLRGLLKI